MKRRICAACAALWMALACLAPQALALPSRGGTERSGADISVFQGEVDFRRLAQSGAEILYIRAGFGTTEDDRFAENAAGAAAAGIRHGFYLYVTARTEAEAEQQARYFADLLRGKTYQCRPAMDFEDFSGLTDAQARSVGLRFLQELERQTGQVPLLYADAWAVSAIWTDSAFARYPLWIAEYGPAQPTAQSGVWSGWSGFQYTDRGALPGISGAVDLDRFTDAVLLRPEEAPASRTYTVRPGDTLWAIARRYGTTVTALAAANGIQDPDRICPGQVLRIPGASPEKVYTVRPGDTLWAIARRYGTTVTVLAAANGIQDPDRIYPGQVLRIPG